MSLLMLLKITSLRSSIVNFILNIANHVINENNGSVTTSTLTKKSGQIQVELK